MTDQDDSEEDQQAPTQYTLRFTRSAVKDAKRLDKAILRRIQKKLQELTADPTAYGATRLQGTDRAFYRIRVGDYRVLYEILVADLEIRIARIGHRSEVYDDLDDLEK